jgi:exopolysaccharide biosynthesis protein
MSNNHYYGQSPGRPSGVPVRRRTPARAQKRNIPVPLLIVIYLLAAALLLLIFYLTNIAFHSESGPLDSLPEPSSSVSASPAGSSPATSAGVSSSPLASSTASSSPAAIDPNNWGAKYADKFAKGAVEKTENSYKSANISVTIEKVQKEKLTYYVADIYIAELKYFKTAFAKKPEKMGYIAPTTTTAKQHNAIIAINGDYCLNNAGIIIRNGKVYDKDRTSSDQLVMYYDGTMKAFSPEEITYEQLKADGAWQVWSFGPMLLNDGKAPTEYNLPQAIGGANPRTALGYYAPGHYCFVVVDGRQGSYSEGLTLSEMSELFSGLGCKVAFNLDGGQTSEMALYGEFVNQPYHDGRSCSDIVYIADE